VLGIFAGAGRFPLLLVRRARRLGVSTTVVALERVTLPAVAREAGGARWLAVGQIGLAAQHLLGRGATEVVLAGGVPRNPLAVRPRPDGHALRLATGLAGGDDRLLRRVAQAFEGLGLAVVPPGELATALHPTPGRLGGPEASAYEADLRHAWRAAVRQGARDRGQAAVARGGRVLCEDIRGTDVLLHRASRLARGGVLAKVAKPGQDRRFDMPAIGPATIAGARRAGLAGVAVEAGATLVIDQRECAHLADELGVGLWCLQEP